MSVTLRKYLNVIEIIAAIKDERVLKGVLNSVKKDKQFFKALREIAKNTVSGKVYLSKPQKKKLRKYKRKIEKIACSHKNCPERCKFVIQSGGYLPILIPSVVALISSLIK